MVIRDYFKEKKDLIDKFLDFNLPPENEYPETIHKAIRYSVFAGGKRLRPILCLASNHASCGNERSILPIACALELIHTYSLIHDDLPAIDNDSLRRGKPANHIVFGESIAILAGDALLTKAFEFCVHAQVNPNILLNIINEISMASGTSGMIGGEVLDILSEKIEVELPTLEYIHTHKTGKLISCAVRIGAMAENCASKKLSALTNYGEKIGLAFQIIDDILDEEGDEQSMGKTKSDKNRGKSTYPKVMGIKKAKKRAEELISLAIEYLSLFGQEAEPLRSIANFILTRSN